MVCASPPLLGELQFSGSMEGMARVIAKNRLKKLESHEMEMEMYSKIIRTFDTVCGVKIVLGKMTLLVNPEIPGNLPPQPTNDQFQHSSSFSSTPTMLRAFQPT